MGIIFLIVSRLIHNIEKEKANIVNKAIYFASNFSISKISKNNRVYLKLTSVKETIKKGINNIDNNMV